MKERTTRPLSQGTPWRLKGHPAPAQLGPHAPTHDSAPASFQALDRRLLACGIHANCISAAMARESPFTRTSPVSRVNNLLSFSGTLSVPGSCPQTLPNRLLQGGPAFSCTFRGQCSRPRHWPPGDSNRSGGAGGGSCCLWPFAEFRLARFMRFVTSALRPISSSRFCSQSARFQISK